MESGLSVTEGRSEGVLHSPRSPLLWLLLPGVAGLTTARFLPIWTFSYASCLAALGLGVAVWSHFGTKRQFRWFAFSYPIAIASLGLAWGLKQFPDFSLLPYPPTNPPREAMVTISVQRSFRSSAFPGYERGIGFVVAADRFVTPMLGKRVQYSASAPEDAKVTFGPGTRFEAVGVVEWLPAAEETNDPWTRELRAEGVEIRFSQGRIRRVEAGSLGPVEATLSPWRRHIWQILTRAPPSQTAEAGIVGAMLLGDRDLLTTEDRDLFLRSGTMHLFAVSGLHVMAVAGALYAFGMLLRLSPRDRTFLMLTVLGFYVILIGSPPSAWRAYLMVAFYAVGRTFWRNTSPFPAVVASAVVVLLLFPHQIHSLGFQLSYLVVATILLWGLPLGEALDRSFTPRAPALSDTEERWRRRIARPRHYLCHAFGVSLAASCASTPLIISAFDLFSPGAVLLNLILVPAAGIVVVNGLLVLVFGLVGISALSLFQAHAGWLVAVLMRYIVEITLAIPGTSARVEWRHPALGPLISIGFIVLLGVMHGTRRPGRSLDRRVLLAPFIYLAGALGVGMVLLP